MGREARKGTDEEGKIVPVRLIVPGTINRDTSDNSRDNSHDNDDDSIDRERILLRSGIRDEASKFIVDK